MRKRTPTQFIRQPDTNKDGEVITDDYFKENQDFVAQCAAVVKTHETGEQYVVKPA